MNNEIKNLVKDLFEDAIIGVDGVRNDNGSDYYICPCCGMSEDTSPYATDRIPIYRIKHEQDCKLMRLYNLVNKEN